MDNQTLSRKPPSKAKDCVVVEENADKHEANSGMFSLSSGEAFDHSFGHFCLGKPYYNNNCYNVYPLVESMPIPEPIWSTTQPCILASNNLPSFNNNPKDLLDLEEPLFDDDEFAEYYNHDQASSSSYTWWVGFLKSLDGENSGGEYFYKCPNEYGCESNNVTPYVVDVTGSSSSSAISDKSGCGTTEEWLSFPSTPKDEGETTIPIPP